LADIEKRMTAALDDHGTRLREIDGIGAVTAVRLIGRTGMAYHAVDDHLAERGTNVDHVTVSRWVQRFAPLRKHIAATIPAKRA
jgi:transposase-like protein